MPGQSGPGADQSSVPTALLYLIILILACMLPVGHAAAAEDDSRGTAEFDHAYWKARDGLPGQVSALAQTTDGFLWMATGRTLYRFDGTTFEPFRLPDGERFPRVRALAAHPDGSLWAGLDLGGLVRIHEGKTHRFAEDAGVPAGAILGLAVDQHGDLIATMAGAVVTGSERGWRTQPLRSDTGSPDIRVVMVDRDGGAWAGGPTLWHRAPGQDRFVLSPEPVSGVSAMAQAPDGGIWVAESSSGTIFPLDPRNPGDGRRPALVQAADALVFDVDGGLWIGTPGDGLRYAAEPRAAAGQSPPAPAGVDALSGEVVGSALRDREQSLWFGTNGGLDRLRRSDLAGVGFPAAAYNFALAIDATGVLWAGSMNRHALRLAGNRLTSTPVPPPITVAATSAQGGVWLAGPGGFWRSRGAAIERVMGLPDGIGPPAIVRAVVETSDGDLWASIDRHGLYRWRRGTWTLQPVRGERDTQRMPVRALLGDDGRAWFGFRDNLLASVDQGQVRYWGPQHGLDVGHVTALLQAGPRFWVGGTQGLGMFDGERFVPMRFADGFRISGLHGLVATATGELWLHGNEGLARIDAQQLERFGQDASYRVRPSPVGPLEPLADDLRQLRPLPTTVAGEDGKLWIATSTGVRRADPGTYVAAATAPIAHVAGLHADDGPVHTRPGAVLPPLPRRVVIGYTAAALRSPELLRFRYRLRGYDEDWHSPDTAREASYIGLPPGRYVFEVAAAYGDGPWSALDSTHFEIPPALHQTRQFIVLCATALLLVLWMAYRVRVRYLASALRARLEVQHLERERIARELHDTLLQSVQGLILRFQAASNALAHDEPARRSLELALEQADQVMVEGRDRVVDLRSPAKRSGGIFDALAAFGDELAAVHGTRFRALSQASLPALPDAVEEEIFRIAKEALANAFQHAQAREIEIELLSDRDGIRLRVRDDGVGMPERMFQQRGRAGHWGLIGMRERAERIGARFQIWSREGSGTEVDLCLPWGSLETHARSMPGWLRWFRRRS